MKTSLARRYAPLAAVLAVQLIIIALVPSRASDSGDEFATGDSGYVDPTQGAGGDGDVGGAGVDSEGNPVEGGDGGSGDGGSGGGGSGGGEAGGGEAGGGGTGGGGTGGGGTGGGGGAPPGDTSHCKAGRQHGLTYYSPPCVPNWGGGNNGGSTYPGVTDKAVKVVVYNSQSDPAVDALLKGVDLSSSDAEEQQFRDAAEEFINKHYEFYGRKFDLDVFNGTCDLLPPDYPCLRKDMDNLVKSKKPFFVIWNTPLASAAFEELSKLRVPNAGGHHFDDKFSTSRRPYHWDWRMSGTKVARFLSEYWCKKLKGGKAVYGANSDVVPDMTLTTRKLGVITPNDPANQRVLAEFKGFLKSCGTTLTDREVYSYGQDIDRAQEQRKAGIAKMRAAKVTTIMCICDGIAPYFMVITEDEDRYWPENIVPGTGGMDFDAVGRLYNVSSTWGRALGVSTLPILEPYNNNDAARVWKGVGRSGNPPYNLAINDWSYFEMVANMIQMAGPNLNPGTLEQGAFRTGRPSNSPLHDARSFSAGDYSQVDDIKEVYWSRTAPSNLDGRPGAYLSQNGGKRYQLGQVPKSPASRPAA